MFLRRCAGSPKVAGIPVIAPEKDTRAQNFSNALREWKPEIIVVVAYGRILAKTILELSAIRMPQRPLFAIAKVPRGCTWCVDDHQRRRDSGVTTMKLVEKMDAGPIYLQEATEVAAG